MDIINARKELLFGKTIYDMNLKVADYSRVSTDKKIQLNSLENQKNYFSEMIGKVPLWTHVKSYIDEGISGTSTKNRKEFLNMINDAKNGKIDLILTKEVSRFARNTIDSIKYTEELLKSGTIVFFLSDNINTIYPDSEFRLTLMASMAQDEVRKLSERVKFGIQRSIKDGKLGGSSLYGYYKKDGKLFINKNESPAVELLFKLYVTGEYTFNEISNILKNKGYYTRKNKQFTSQTLKKMLTNPRYKGYYTANMSVVEDYKTHKKKRLPQKEWIIYKDYKNIVPEIIDSTLWNQANKIYKLNISKKEKYKINQENKKAVNELTSKIICFEHNIPFIKSSSGKRKNNPTWQCDKYLRHGLKGCVSPIIKDETIHKILINNLKKNLIIKQSEIENIYYEYKNIINQIVKQNNQKKIKLELEKITLKKNKLIEMNLDNLITKKDLKYELSKLLKKEEKLSETDNNIINDNTLENISKYINDFYNIDKNANKFIKNFIDKIYIIKNPDRNHIFMKIRYTSNFIDQVSLV